MCVALGCDVLSATPAYEELRGETRRVVTLASFLRGAASKSDRSARLKMAVHDAKEQGIELRVPGYARPEQPIKELLENLNGLPLLVLGSNTDELLGIVTAFDLL